MRRIVRDLAVAVAVLLVVAVTAVITRPEPSVTRWSFSGALSIRNLQGSSTPYDVPIALALLKLPSGALSAMVGLLFVRGGFVPGLSQLDSQPQILAYAFLFGAAQQLVTRLVDQQAQDILTKMPSKEPTSRKPEPSPAEQPTPGARPARRLRRILTGGGRR
jgi:hypothetical protein